jgi:hypothetical protein
MEKKMSFAEYMDSINPLTIGQLRKAIEALPDDMQVLVGSAPEGAYADWFNLSQTFGVPTRADDSEWSAFTLFPVDNYDSRQF